MDQEKINRLNQFLLKRGLNIDTISPNKHNQLSKVDDVIQYKLSTIASANEIIKENSITVVSVSTDTGISRKTFYNNELLKEYVEYYSNSISEKDISQSNDKQKNKILEIQSQIT